MARGLFKRIGATAVAVNADGRAALHAVKDGATFTADITSPKNQEQVNLFFALRDLVCEARDTARDPTKEWLLERAGFFDVVWYPDGTFGTRPHSVAEMDQDTFDQCFNACLPIIQEELQVDRQDLLKRYFELLDPNTRAAARRRLNPRPAPVARRHRADVRNRSKGAA